MRIASSDYHGVDFNFTLLLSSSILLQFLAINGISKWCQDCVPLDLIKNHNNEVISPPLLPLFITLFAKKNLGELNTVRITVEI